MGGRSSRNADARKSANKKISPINNEPDSRNLLPSGSSNKLHAIANNQGKKSNVNANGSTPAKQSDTCQAALSLKKVLTANNFSLDSTAIYDPATKPLSGYQYQTCVSDFMNLQKLKPLSSPSPNLKPTQKSTLFRSDSSRTARPPPSGPYIVKENAIQLMFMPVFGTRLNQACYERMFAVFDEHTRDLCLTLDEALNAMYTLRYAQRQQCYKFWFHFFDQEGNQKITKKYFRRAIHALYSPDMQPQRDSNFGELTILKGTESYAIDNKLSEIVDGLWTYVLFNYDHDKDKALNLKEFMEFAEEDDRINELVDMMSSPSLSYESFLTVDWQCGSDNIDWKIR